MEPIQEVKSIVTDMGKQFEEFKHAHSTLQNEIKTINTEDVLLKERVEKLANLVAANHEAATRRLDEAKARASRPASDEKAEMDLASESRELRMANLSLKGKLPADEIEGSVEEFKAYSRAFGKLMRNGDRSLSADEFKALSVGSDPDGGYLVKPFYSGKINERIFESSPIRQLATIETISTDSFSFIDDPNEFDAGWVGETQSRAETTTAAIAERKITVHEMYAKPKATQKLLEDAAIDIEAWHMKKVAAKFGRKEATAFVSGTGSTQPRGFLTYPTGTDWGQIQQVASGAATTWNYTGMLNLITSLKEEFHRNAKFLIKRESVATLMLVQDGDSSYIFRPLLVNGNMNMAPVLGYELRYASDMPAVAANALAMAFGDFAEGYTIVDRLGISVLPDPYSSKPYVEFYSRRRVGGDVNNFDAIKISKLST